MDGAAEGSQLELSRDRLWVERERENETESEGANERRTGIDCGGCSEMF